MDNIAIGNYLIKLREKAGYTQTEVGNLIGVSNKTISKWECGDGLPNYDSLVALASLYHVTVDEILRSGASERKIEAPKPKDLPIGYLVMEIIAVAVMGLFGILFLSLGSIVDVRISFALSLVSLASGLSLHLVSLRLYGYSDGRIKILEAFNHGLLFLTFVDAMTCFSTVWIWGFGGSLTMGADLLLTSFFLMGMVPSGLISGLFAYGFSKGNSFGENVSQYGRFIIGGFLAASSICLLIAMVPFFREGMNGAGIYSLIVMLVAIAGSVLCFVKDAFFDYLFSLLLFALCFIGIFVTQYRWTIYSSGIILLTIESAALFGLRFLSRLGR